METYLHNPKFEKQLIIINSKIYHPILQNLIVPPHNIFLGYITGWPIHLSLCVYSR